MFTLFTTAKPFLGHSGIIQINALQSWKHLHPDVEVILFGDDDGAAEVAHKLDIHHEPHVERHPSGAKYINSMFDRAQEIARHDILCYANCDIILTQDILDAIRRVRTQKQNFLIVGRRWDTEVTELLDFTNPEWAGQIRNRALATNQQRDEWWTDYFLFSRNLYYKKIPAFLIGRIGWDNWLTWWAKQSGAAVVDASDAVCAIHQNHTYAYHPQGKEGVWSDELSRRNFELAGGFAQMRSIASAAYRLTTDKLSYNSFHHLREWRFRLARRAERVQAVVRISVWHSFLDFTRPVRHALGIKQKSGVSVRQRRHD